MYGKKGRADLATLSYPLPSELYSDVEHRAIPVRAKEAPPTHSIMIVVGSAKTLLLLFG